MKIFMICPVRNVSPSFSEGVDTEVARLEAEGHEVYYPPRDTDQSLWEYGICHTNYRAMMDADEVRICWDGESQECIFDLAMAFVMEKKISPVVGLFPRVTKGKSFNNLVYEMEGHNG